MQSETLYRWIDKDGKQHLISEEEYATNEEFGYVCERCDALYHTECDWAEKCDGCDAALCPICSEDLKPGQFAVDVGGGEVRFEWGDNLCDDCYVRRER